MNFPALASDPELHGCAFGAPVAVVDLFDQGAHRVEDKQPEQQRLEKRLPIDRLEDGESVDVLETNLAFGIDAEGADRQVQDALGYTSPSIADHLPREATGGIAVAESRA